MESGIITDVSASDDNYYINIGSIGFCLLKSYNVIPKEGDHVILYTYNGSVIRGIKINGIMIFYKSDLELEEEHKALIKRMQERRLKEFEDNKKKLDKMYNSLPLEFKKRIDIFRENNPKFRVDYESYELFCCKEAVLIAKTLKTPDTIKEFAESNNKFNLVKKLSKDHSGNTMGMSIRLAYLYVTNPENIYRFPGALSPIVGSKEYEEKNKRRNLL